MAKPSYAVVATKDPSVPTSMQLQLSQFIIALASQQVCHCLSRRGNFPGTLVTRCGNGERGVCEGEDGRGHQQDEGSQARSQNARTITLETAPPRDINDTALPNEVLLIIETAYEERELYCDSRRLLHSYGVKSGKLTTTSFAMQLLLSFLALLATAILSAAQVGPQATQIPACVVRSFITTQFTDTRDSHSSAESLRSSRHCLRELHERRSAVPLSTTDRHNLKHLRLCGGEVSECHGRATEYVPLVMSLSRAWTVLDELTRGL